MKIHMKLLVAFSFLFLALFLVHPRASATGATLGFKDNTTAEGEIKADIYLDTGGKTANALSADFTYPENLLEVTDINTQDSICDNFIEKDYSTPGKVYLSCFSLDGMSGLGTVATVTFKITAAGSVNLTFLDSAAVLDASDSSDILTKTEIGEYTISSNLSTLPETGTSTQGVTLSALLAFTLVVLAVIFALATFSMWGGIYLSLGKWDNHKPTVPKKTLPIKKNEDKPKKDK